MGSGRSAPAGWELQGLPFSAVFLVSPSLWESVTPFVPPRFVKCPPSGWFETSQLNILGNIQITTQSMQELAVGAFRRRSSRLEGLLSAHFHLTR
jgi:hypothetical protein